MSAEYRAGFRQGGGTAIAALARMSRRGLEGDHAPAVYLVAAEKGFRHLQEHSLECLPDGRENIIDDYCALLAACELLAATGSDEYRAAARARADNLASRISRNEGFAGWWRADDRGELPFFHAVEAALLPLAGESGMVPALKAYAADQMNWILGLNPYDACMLHGKGRNNPEYEWGWFNAPGGIANGITSGFRDETDIDFLPEQVAHEGMHRWRWSEQWIRHAAWFFLAACMEP